MGTVPRNEMGVKKKIAEWLKKEASAENRVVLMRFFKTGKGQYGYGDKFLGVKVPQTRAIVKQYWEECELDDVEKLIASKYHEIRLAGLLVLVKKYYRAERQNNLDLQQRIVKFYLAHTDKINNWDLVDLSCYEILGRWAKRGSEGKKLLVRLARSKNMWEQRIAIVSTMYLVRNGEFLLTLKIADMLLMHEHDLIHKAVGWLLREVGKRDGELLKEYLRTRYQRMPRTMLRYAIEKLPAVARKCYLMGKVK